MGMDLELIEMVMVMMIELDAILGTGRMGDGL